MKEEEIRPKSLFEEFLRIIEEEVFLFFGDSSGWQSVLCPVCEIRNPVGYIKKNLFLFSCCEQCRCLYLNPCPEQNKFDFWYKKSMALEFLAQKFYSQTRESRMAKIWKPRVAEIIERFGSGFQFLDIGGGSGIFGEALRASGQEDYLCVDPSEKLVAACKEKGLSVIEKSFFDLTSEDLCQKKRIFTAFELLEHLQNPRLFFQEIYKLMRADDFAWFTTLNGDGFDISLLKEHSNSISPPNHICFLNPFAVKKICEQIGFSVCEVSTPGKLDLELALQKKKFLPCAWKEFLSRFDELAQKNFQIFLSNHNLSSHMRIILKK